MSFYSNKKQENEKKAEEALVAKNYAKAFFHTAKAAEYGLLLAEQSEGKIAKKFIEDAFDLIEIAEELKAKAQTESKESVDRTLKEATGEHEEVPSAWELQEKPDMKLDDVAGLDEVKEILREDVIQPFEHPEVYERFRQKAGAGVLMYGPPGNGKTFIARAIAGELDAAFFPVDCARIKDKYVGETEKNLKKLFEEVQSHERSVLFFDEVEALLGRRGNRKINTVTQFLALTDGVVKSKNCILLLAATNKPWQLDEAVLRPGRLGTHIHVGLPDAKAREAIIAYNMREVPVAADVSFTALAEKTEGHSGADMTEICKQAKKAAIRRQLQSNKEEEIKEEDIKMALEKVKPSVTNINLEDFKKWETSRTSSSDDENDD